MLSIYLKLFFVADNFSFPSTGILNSSYFSSKFRTFSDLIISELWIWLIIFRQNSTFFCDSYRCCFIIPCYHSDSHLSLLASSNSLLHIISQYISNSQYGNTCQIISFDFSINIVVRHFIMINSSLSFT